MRLASAIGLLIGAALAASACNIENHEGLGSHDEGLCVSYCGRLSACGASQADDIEACLDACEDRFEHAYDYQRELCECSEWSSCDDLEQGRCSSEYPEPEPEPEPEPVGGSTSVGGGTSSGNAGSSTGGSTTGPGPCGEGGAPSSGQGGASGGGGQGGQAPDLPPPTPCVRDCDCLLTEWCVDGYCSTEQG